MFGDPALVVYPPDRVRLRSAVDALLASGFRDLEGMFYQVLKLAHAGDSDRAVEILDVTRASGSRAKYDACVSSLCSNRSR